MIKLCLHAFLAVFLGFTPAAFASLLTVQISSEPNQFDPLMLDDGNALKIAANTVGTLFQYDGAGNREKYLVDHYSVSRDRLHYTFVFKKNLKWSDGQAFQAADFGNTIKRLSQEAVKSSLAYLLPKIDYQKSHVVNAISYELVLEEQDEQIPNWLTLPLLAPIREDMITAYLTKRSPVAPTLNAYEIVDYKREEFIKLKKNPFALQLAPNAIDEVMIRIVGDEGALVPLLKSGSIDILNKVPVLQSQQVADVGRVVDVPLQAITYLGFNTKELPFSERKNRKFIQALLNDQKRLELAKLLKTDEFPAFHFLPALLAPQGFLPHVAPQLPKEALPEFELQSDGGSRNQSIVEFVQATIKAGAQTKVKINVLEWKAHYAKLRTSPAPLFRFGWQNPINDAYVMYQVFSAKSPNNLTGWSSASYDDLLAKLRQEKTDVKKTALIRGLETILEEEAPVIPLLHQNAKFGVSKRVLGFRANSFGVILFRELRLDESLKH